MSKNLSHFLEEIEAQGYGIGVGLIGAGKMGRTIIHQIRLAKGIRLAAVAEIYVERAVEALRKAGYRDEEIRSVRSLEEAERAGDGVVVTSDASILMELNSVDVIIDATGAVEVGARMGYEAIMRRKNYVMMNAEADATFGPLLARLAELAGVVYTGDLGDEPGTVMHYLYDPFKSMGFRVVAAGKGKNNPLQRYATPESVSADAEKKKLNPRILASFVDGTKTMVEMTILSNATGLLPDRRGMHGPKASVRELSEIFKGKDRGGILENEGVVDYVIGIAPGVFIVVDTEDEEVKENFKYLRVGEKPPYAFYRPYHLPGNETVLSAVWAVIYETPIIAPIGHFSDAVAFAKKDLSAGEVIDGIGGHTVYGLIERREISRDEGLLPIGLSEGAKLRRSVRRDEPLHLDDVELEEGLAYRLWRLQEKVIG